MFKLIVLFSLLAVAFAAPKPDPLLPLTYTPSAPLIYSSQGAAPIYNYGYSPYAANYYGGYAYHLPLAYY